MATALQRQLAQISANSTHQLDLKAQKAQHAKSLLFEPQDASRQSFDDIFNNCIEGFEELCQLDSRFTSFSNNLFSESSKEVDRGQLAKSENEEIDGVLAKYLGLVQGRLLLKPAQRSVEWLVRRWRVHEFDTEALLLTFLPYHSDERTFPALLAVLPTERPLPESFKWLHPYIASFSCPPRHALLSAAVSNRSLLTSFNSFVLGAAKAGHASTLTLSFWAGLVAQAVNGMIDSSRSGRDEIRRQREEEILLRILPILQEAFIASKKAKLDGMYLGACMIATVLATKASLSDAALDAIMEAVARASTDRTMGEMVSCLAILAEEKSELSIPTRVARVLSNDTVVATILRHAESQRVSKLAAGLATNVVRGTASSGDNSELHMVQAMLGTGALDEQDAVEVLKALTAARDSAEDNPRAGALSEIISSITHSERYSALLQQHGHELGLLAQHDLPEEPLLADEMELDTPSQSHSNQSVSNIQDINELLDKLPQLPSELYSFLEPNHENFDIFQAYSRMFQSAIDSDSSSFFKAFLDVPSLHRGASASQPTFLSFLARLWSSGTAMNLPVARARALEVARDHIATLHSKHARNHINDKTKDILPDFQALLPYLFAALSDDKRKIRTIAAELCSLIAKISQLSETKDDYVVWGSNSIYGLDTASDFKHAIWLTRGTTGNFLRKAITPVLEDCVLDSSYLARRLIEVLDSSTSAAAKSDKKSKPLSKDTRAMICGFLASHAWNMPVLRTKLILLQLLKEVGKEANEARECLVGFAKEWMLLPTEQVQNWCNNEGVDLREMDVNVVGILTQKSEYQIHCLKEICFGSDRKQLVELAFNRLQELWPAIKSASTKIELVGWLQELALTQAYPELPRDCALETLRSLELPLEVAIHMIEALPTASDLETQPPTSKRQRRSSENERKRAVDDPGTDLAIRKITLVLELLEAAKMKSPTLLRPMFHLLAELRHFKTLTGSDLVYLYTLSLDTILAIVNGLRADKTSADKLQRDAIRTDLLIDCVRSTSSAQIHNIALLIVSALASLAPESVLHSIVPLFTFMSSTVLRRGDEYSAHVTDQAISRIIPALVSSLKNQSRGLLGGLSELLLSFVAAWEHVPLHRRLDLFDEIIRAIGVDDCLGVVLAMLTERYSTGNSSSISGFVPDLANRFWALNTIKAANQWIELIFTTMQPATRSKHKSDSLSDSLLSFSDKDEDEQEDALVTMLEGLQTLLENETIKGRLAVAALVSGPTEAGKVRTEYAKLTEKVIELAQLSATTSSILKAAADSLFSAVLSLLPTEAFVTSCAQLMQSGSSSVRRQVFQSLESRVYQAKSSNVGERQTFLDILPSCAVFIQQDQPVEVRIAAIGCIDAICNKFGKSEVQSVRNAAKQVAGSAALGADNNELRTFSLLCLASVAGVLGDGDESIGLFPGVIAQTLDYLALSVTPVDNNAVIQHDDVKPLQDAGFSLLTATLDHIPWIVTSSPAHLDRALDIAASVVNASATVSEFTTLVAKKVPALELFTSIQRIWPLPDEHRSSEPLRQTSPGYTKVGNLVKVLHQAVQNHTKATITKNASTLFSCLLKAFDIRRHIQHSSIDVDVSREDNLFTNVDQLALDTTLKLNDATFRPFFMRVIGWASSPNAGQDAKDRTERLKSIYSFALLLFEKLKSLVTSYVSYLLDSVSEVLRADPKLPVDGPLLQLVLETLGSSFRNDEDDFWMAPAHFDVVATPLVKLLGVEHAPQDSRTEAMISTITDLAAAVTSSPEQLKAINANLLSLLRHDKASVRLSAVQCQRSVTKRVTLDWCALLPELLPAISELQEDDDERVERNTLLWVQEIEDITGESLAGMLA